MKRSKKMFVVVMTLCLALSMAMASVTANAATKKPKKIYLTTTSSTVDIKGKVKVSVKKVSPKKASKSVKWKSSNKKIATVSKSGYVTGKKKGTVKITATSKKSKKVKKTIKITVKDLKAKSVTLNKTSAVLFPNDKTTLKATVKGQTGFYNQGVTWKSSNTSVATVDSKGNVTAKKAGKATITATEKGGSKKATCAVTVSGIKVDKANKSVSVTATVNNASEKSMHYVVYKNGKAAATSYFVTDATPAELNAALGKISAKAWDTQSKIDTKKDKVAQAGNKTIDELAQSGVGNKNYTKFDITIKNGNQTINMVDTLKDAKDNDNFSMVYSNVANNVNVGSGCLTCNTSCFAGVVTNEFKTWAEPFVPQNMPAKGTTVTITYTAQTDNYISPKQLKDNADKYVILDARKAESYKAGHIDHAVSADVDGMISENGDKNAAAANVKAVVDKYGKAKKYAVICYSGNRYAAVASAELRKLGVSNDNIFTLGGDKARKSSTGGMKAWEAAGYDVVPYVYADQATVKKAMTVDKTVILDSRIASDYATKHIPGSVSADVGGMVAENGDKDAAAANVQAVVDKYGKDKKYYIICYSGNRYAKAATDCLIKDGVDASNIAILTGGMNAWAEENKAYVVEKHTSSSKIEFANGITVANLKADVAGSKIYTVMDVRAASDYNNGHIDNAVSTPSDDETAIMDTVKKNPNGLYVLVCYSGNSKAKAARDTMVKNGVDESRIICLEGGMGAWK